MSYKPTRETKDWEAPPGLGPWRELSDAEYEALKASYDGDISRWYEPTEADEPPKRARKMAAEAAGGNDR